MTKPLTQKQQSLAEAAACNFWKFRNNVSKKIMSKTLPKVVQDQLIGKLAEDGIAVDGTRFIIDLFGPHQADFKEHCIKPGAAIHTHTYANTFAEAEGSPNRLVYVKAAIKFEKESDALIDKARTKFEAFLPDYEKFAEAGRRAADHNLPYKVHFKGRTFTVSQLLVHLGAYPSKEEFAASFKFERSPFEPLSVFDVKKFSNVPPEFVERHAAKTNRAVLDAMEYRKEQTIKLVDMTMDLLADRFANAKRLPVESNNGLIEKAERAAEVLLELADGYNNSQMLRSMSKTITERIVEPAKKWESFKEDDKAKAAASRAASAVQKKLGQVSKAAAPQQRKPQPKASRKPVKKGKAVGGGVLGRKARRKAAASS